MLKFTRMALTGLVLSGSILSPFVACADDAKAQVLLEESAALFAERADLTKAQAAAVKLNQAEAEAVDPELKYDILILNARTQYFLGTKAASDDAKKQIFMSAMVTSDRAIALDKASLGDTYAEAYYFKATSRGRWGEVNGVLASLQYSGEVIQNAETAISKITRDGDEGESFEGFGPRRLLGRVYFKLPGFAGGSNRRALENLKPAFEKAPQYASNQVYYADLLANTDKAAEAKVILQNLLKNDPAQLNAERIPETEMEFEEARNLLKNL